MYDYKQVNIKLNKELYEKVKNKCTFQLGIGLSPLIKIFLTSFISQKGLGLYIGDEYLSNIVSRWIRKKKLQIYRKGSAPLPGPLLKEIYDLNTLNKLPFEELF